MKYSNGRIVIAIALLGVFGITSVACVARINKLRSQTNGNSFPSPSPTRTPANAATLLGVWTGTWGHDQRACIIEIDRIDGNSFYGFLKKYKAKVAFIGTLEPETGRISIQETKVIELGNYGGWSLGTNYATISADGRSIEGGGTDKWGEYSWSVSRE